MRDVEQINKMTCFLACLQSFFEDRGIKMSQEVMIKLLLNLKLCDPEGLVPFQNMSKACNALGLDITEIAFHYPIDKKYEDGTLLIGTTIQIGTSEPGFHCRRFFRQEEEGKIIVMDPKFGGKFYWDRPLVIESKPILYKIAMVSG